jgi:site-specific DNA recombinase
MERQVQSIDDQKKVMLDMARMRNLEVVEVFEESQSAKAPGRPVFSQMIERIHKGEVQGILTWKLDRIARNPIDGGSIIWALQNGIIQKIITNDREYCPSDNVLLVSVEFGMANQFILDLSKNVKRGMNAKYEKGIRPTLTPLGYLNDKIEHTNIIDPERFPLIRKMWDFMLTGGYTPERIAQIASKEWGLTSRTTKRVMGKPVGRSMVYRIFKNPFYFGMIGEDGEVMQGSHEPMITKQEYDCVQKILGKNGNPRAYKRDFSFTGLLQCGECGCAITAEEKSKYRSSENRIKTYTYYHCTKKKMLLDGSRCPQKSLEKEALEAQISDFLGSIQISDRFLEWAKKWLLEQTGKEIEDRETICRNLKKKVESATKKLDNLIQLKISDPDSLSEEEFKNHKKAVISERNEAQIQLKKLDDRQDEWIDLTKKTFDFCQVAKEKFEKGTDREKRNILICIGSKLVLKDGKLDIKAKKVFQVLKKSVREEQEEMARFEPIENGEGTTKKAPFGAVCSRWLGRKDSNLRMTDSESVALPLGDSRIIQRRV